MLRGNDLDLVLSFIYLPLTRKVLENNLGKVKNVGFKFEEPYLSLIEKTINKISMDIRDLKKEMRKTGITVYDQGKVNEKCSYLVVCRGYREEFNLFPHLMKVEVQNYLNQYLLKTQVP
ncbi:hypothetical protein [Halalkalibacter okhensis]|uniref:Uncharacterized protein n=1 Tax=Halalkalibacter okhensis TaxID=333138 RepID=A0A0B0III3_9BACI|nr:hypothetical protein [Halalkalibacter okhensis]KHF40697.1 hypothetical protein LQ50_07850 [Halalkalibacter okhensis]